MQLSNRKNLLILSLTLVVVTLGFGLVMPIIPFYMEQFGAGGTELGLLVASYAVMRLIFGPIWGSLSDRVGRKPILLIGVLGYGITMVGFGLATQLWMMFVARILSGVLSSATSPTTMAYISDSTSEEERSGGMGMLGAAAGIGTIFGPALGGLLADRSLSTPFFVAAGLSFFTLFLIFLFLPESLQEGKRSSSESDQPMLDPRSWWNALFSPIGPLLIMAFIVTCSGNFSSTTRSPVCHAPLTNCTTPTRKPWPSARNTMPKAAVDLPLPLPVWTISRPFSMVLVAMILSRAAFFLRIFSA